MRSSALKRDLEIASFHSLQVTQPIIYSFQVMSFRYFDKCFRKRRAHTRSRKIESYFALPLAKLIKPYAVRSGSALSRQHHDPFVAHVLCLTPTIYARIFYTLK